MENIIKMFENRNKVFYLFLVAALILLLIIYIMAQKQNEAYWQDYADSEQVVALLAQEQYEEAGVILQDLQPRHPESPQIHWYYGIYLANQGKYQEAQTHYDQALALAPSFQEQEVFLWRYGENLFHLGQLESARGYLEQCCHISTQPEIKAEAEKILNQIITGD